MERICPCRFKEGKLDRTGNGREGSGHCSSAARLAGTLFLCQTVFWQRPHPHSHMWTQRLALAQGIAPKRERKGVELNRFHVNFWPPALSSPAALWVRCAGLLAAFERSPSELHCSNVHVGQQMTCSQNYCLIPDFSGTRINTYLSKTATFSIWLHASSFCLHSKRWLLT